MYTINFKEKREILKKKHERFNVSDEYYNLSQEEIEKINNSRKIPLSLAIINTTGEYNVSSMIRTASVFGFKKAYVFGRRRFDSRGLVGSNHYIEIIKVNSLDDEGKIIIKPIIDTIIRDKLAPIVFETDGESIVDIDWKKHISSLLDRKMTPTIFLGNEWEGFDRKLVCFLKSLPYSLYVRIPQNGVLRSLNVSCAMSIATWDIIKSMDWIYKNRI